MNAVEFKKLATTHLAPKLKEKGWKGSAFQYFKTTDNGVIQFFGIQDTWYGGSVSCETAIHFDFLPDLNGHMEPFKMSNTSCLIRHRLSPKAGGELHWTFKAEEKDNVTSLNQIFEALENFGSQFYKDFENFPAPFDTISPGDFTGDKKFVLLDKYFIEHDFHFLWLLKEINLKIGRPELAEQFSELGVERATTHYHKLIAEARSKRQKEQTQGVLDKMVRELRM